MVKYLISDSLSKIYNVKMEPISALNHVSLWFPQNGMVFVVGKSGCGKSTLLNILGGLDTPTSGEVYFDGKKVCYDKEQYLDEYRKNNIGFIFQDHLLVDGLTVKENIRSVLNIQAREASEAEIESVLSSVGLTDIANRMPNELSGGQRQRIAIARALIKSPKVILADEPTGNLDSESGKIVFDLLKEISKTVLVIVVSHDLDSAYKYADRIIELKDGEVRSDKQKINEFDLDKLKREYNAAIDKSYVDTATENNEPTGNPTETSLPKTRSQLSTRNAFKTMREWLQASLTKPKNVITTMITIFLLSIALAALGIFNNIRMFSFDSATENGLHNTKYNTVMLLKSDLLNPENSRDEDLTFADNEFQDIEKDFSSVYKTYYYNYDFNKFVNDENDYYNASISGLCELTSSALEEDLTGFFDAKLIAGKYPRKNKNAIEILISDYTAESILYYGGKFDNGTVLPNTLPENLIGKTFENHSVYFKIVGIYECQFSGLYKEKVDKDNAEFSYAKNYVYPIALCVKDSVFEIASSIIGLNVPTELKPLDDEVFINYNCQFLAVDGYDDLEKVSETNGIKIIFSADFNNVFAGNDIIISFNRYLDVFNLYEYSDEGELLSSFDDLKSDDIVNLTIVESYNGETTNYRVVGVFDDSSVSGDLTIVSSAIKDKHLQRLLQIPTIFVALSNSSVSKLISYSKDNNYHLISAFSERLYYFGMLFTMLGNTITIATVILLVFVVMLLAIVISKSLREREKDIGIFRALGANRTDIVKIFIFNDLFYIVASFVISVVLYFIGIAAFNASISSQFGVSVTILSGNILSVLIMFATSLIVVFVASYLPIRKYSSVPPIDIIRGAE